VSWGDPAPRQPLSARDERALRALAAELAARGHTLAWVAGRDGYCGCIDATLDGRPMIGNRTVAQVREMARAMVGPGQLELPTS